MKKFLIAAIKVALWGFVALVVVVGLMLLSEANFDPLKTAAVVVIATLGGMIYQLGRGIDQLQRTVNQLRAEVGELRWRRDHG